MSVSITTGKQTSSNYFVDLEIRLSNEKTSSLMLDFRSYDPVVRTKISDAVLKISKKVDLKFTRERRFDKTYCASNIQTDVVIE